MFHLTFCHKTLLLLFLMSLSNNSLFLDVVNSLTLLCCYCAVIVLLLGRGCLEGLTPMKPAQEGGLSNMERPLSCQE